MPVRHAAVLLFALAGPATNNDFTREEATDRRGADLAMVEVGPRDYAACRAQCAAHAKCIAFTLFTPAADKGYCWLKQGPGVPRADTRTISGIRVSEPQADLVVRYTVDGNPHRSPGLFEVQARSADQRYSGDIAVELCGQYYYVFHRHDVNRIHDWKNKTGLMKVVPIDPPGLFVIDRRDGRVLCSRRPTRKRY